MSFIHSLDLYSSLINSYRNAQGLADVITQSRAFMSSTAKAKTAKLSMYSCTQFIKPFLIQI